MTEKIKVCHHDWVKSPPNDKCKFDGNSCVFIPPNEQVVCWHTGFQSECPLPSGKKCTIDITLYNGGNCFVKSRRQLPYADSGDLIPNSGIIHYKRTSREIKWKNKPFGTPSVARKYQDTAVIIMDMWDHHHIKQSSDRVNELAAPINKFVETMRSLGALIIHSPSGMGGLYNPNGKSTPVEKQARKNAYDARLELLPVFRDRVAHYFPYDLNYDDTILPAYNPKGDGYDGTRQNKLIDILAVDAISAEGIDNCDAYQEVLALTVNRPNLIYVGVHTNWCILRRPNGIKAMYDAGKSIWLVRDLNDAFINNDDNLNHGLPIYSDSWRDAAGVTRDHFYGTSYMVDWIRDSFFGTCADTSEAIGLKRFWFKGDPNRPRSS